MHNIVSRWQQFFSQPCFKKSCFFAPSKWLDFLDIKKKGKQLCLKGQKENSEVSRENKTKTNNK